MKKSIPLAAVLDELFCGVSFHKLSALALIRRLVRLSHLFIINAAATACELHKFLECISIECHQTDHPSVA